MRDNLKKKKEIENDDLENFERRQNGLWVSEKQISPEKELKTFLEQQD